MRNIECKSCKRSVSCRSLCGACYIKEYRKRPEAKEKRRDESSKYYRANKDKANARTAAWSLDNRERMRELYNQYYARNPHISADKRATRKNATPPWADLAEIKAIYKNRPEGFHVDHIIPLQGENVCGLHVPHNLQYLPASENLRKSNKVAA